MSRNVHTTIGLFGTVCSLVGIYVHGHQSRKRHIWGHEIQLEIILQYTFTQKICKWSFQNIALAQVFPKTLEEVASVFEYIRLIK